MSIMAENPSVIVKRKHIQDVLDYCLENRIECKMTPRDMPEEWELEFSVADIMKAISLGMFLKEQKLDLAGFGSATISKTAASVTPKATRTRKTEKDSAKSTPKKEAEELITPVNFFNENNEPSVSAEEDGGEVLEKKDEELFF